MKEERSTSVKKKRITISDRKGGGRSGGARRKIITRVKQKMEYMGSTATRDQ